MVVVFLQIARNFVDFWLTTSHTSKKRFYYIVVSWVTNRWKKERKQKKTFNNALDGISWERGAQSYPIIADQIVLRKLKRERRLGGGCWEKDEEAFASFDCCCGGGCGGCGMRSLVRESVISVVEGVVVEAGCCHRCPTTSTLSCCWLCSRRFFSSAFSVFNSEMIACNCVIVCSNSVFSHHRQKR